MQKNPYCGSESHTRTATDRSLQKKESLSLHTSASYLPTSTSYEAVDPR